MKFSAQVNGVVATNGQGVNFFPGTLRRRRADFNPEGSIPDGCIIHAYPSVAQYVDAPAEHLLPRRALAATC